MRCRPIDHFPSWTWLKVLNVGDPDHREKSTCADLLSLRRIPNFLIDPEDRDRQIIQSSNLEIYRFSQPRAVEVQNVEPVGLATGNHWTVIAWERSQVVKFVDLSDLLNCWLDLRYSRCWWFFSYFFLSWGSLFLQVASGDFSILRTNIVNCLYLLVVSTNHQQQR